MNLTSTAFSDQLSAYETTKEKAYQQTLEQEEAIPLKPKMNLQENFTCSNPPTKTTAHRNHDSP